MKSDVETAYQSAQTLPPDAAARFHVVANRIGDILSDYLWPEDRAPAEDERTAIGLVLHGAGDSFLHGTPHDPYVMAEVGTESVVYFIRAGQHGPIKIGHTVDVVARRARLQTGHPEYLFVLARMTGGPLVEAILHARFATDRIRGEWFRPSRELLALIAELKPPEQR